MNAPKAYAPRYISRCGSPRIFKPGQIVRFSPPPGAYSRICAQYQHAGKLGMVVSSTDSYATLTFGEGIAVLVDTAYLQRESNL